MQRGLNKVQLIGNLGQPPAQRHLPNGNAMSTFSVATSETWKDDQGNKQESTEWHNCVCFGKLAEICGKYLQKGTKVYVEGKLTTRKYDKDGQTHYSTSVNFSEMQILSGGIQANQGQQQGQDQGQGYQQNQGQNQAQGQNQGQQNVPPGNYQNQGQQNTPIPAAQSTLDDDIPW